LSILLRNWHLKLAAIALSTVLYTGLVFSGSFSESTIQVRVEGVNPPDNSIVLSGDLGLVEVRYQTSNDVSITVSDQAFAATVDLSQYDMDRAPDPQVLDIEVVALFDGIEILSVDPESARVAIDRVEVRTVPVEVDPGDVPEGLEIGDPVVSDDEVQVRGPASVLASVDRTEARIRIDASGIDVNLPVALVAVDVRGQPVGAGLVDIEPETVSVQIDVQATETSRTVPIRPDITGTPAPGFALQSLGVDPSTVTLRGLPDVLAGISEVLTEPLSIDDVSSDQAFEAELVLPEGTRLADASAESVATVTAQIGPSVSSRTFVVGLACVGNGDNACLPALDQVTLTLSGPGDALSGLTAADLTPTLDVSGLGPGTYSLPPTVGNLPDGVEMLAITPGSVSVTVRAPATPAP
jgi:YbbR domain-containing protein